VIHVAIVAAALCLLQQLPWVAGGVGFGRESGAVEYVPAQGAVAVALADPPAAAGDEAAGGAA